MRLRNIVFCLLVPALTAFAQTDRGSITGTVVDPSGGVVPNAKIEIKNMDTNAVFQGGSSATGNYAMTQLPVGNYELTVTVQGFKKFVRQNLTVQVAVDTRADVTLAVGATSETVTVTESAPLLKTESGEVSHTVTTDQADQLPVITIGTGGGFGAIRNPLQVANLLPGVQFTADTLLRVNGLPSSSGTIRIEGQDATNGIWREITSINQAGLDAVQEVQVQTSNYAAEFGQAAGGYFNFTMKSGTNAFHGSAYDYYVNEFLNAGLPYTDAGLTNSLKDNQHVRTKQRRDDYGFTIGGPIHIPKVYNGRDKSFFFFNFEQFRETQGFSNQITTVPTTAYQQGNFATAQAVCTTTSAACPGGPGTGAFLTQAGVASKDTLGRLIPQYGVYDPASQFTAPDGTPARNLFPSQIIPATRFDPVSLAIQKLLPQPTNSLLINNYIIPNYTNYKHTTNPSIKIDHSVSPTIKISGFYSAQLTYIPNNNGLDPLLTGVTPTNNRSHTIRANYDQTLKPTLLLHLGAGYIHTFNPAPALPFNESSIGLNGFYSNHFPNFAGLSNGVTGGASLPIGTSSLSGYQQWDEKFTANANLTWVKANHTFKFGGELVNDGVIIDEQNKGQGLFTISGNETRNPYENIGTGFNSSSGFPYASFLMGQVDSFQVAPAADMKLGQHGIGIFAQDSWKVTRNLTVDYGLRYDFQTYPKEQYGRMQDVSFTTLDTKVNRPGAVIYEGYGPGRCNCAFQHNYPWAFGPRLGVAYQLNKKTVLRAGSALTYGTTANQSQLTLNIEDFYQFNAPGFGIPALPSLSVGNPYGAGNPYGNPQLTWPNFDNSKYPTRTICPGTFNSPCLAPQTPFIGVDRSARPPRIFQYSVGLQREITRNLVVEASYIGNRGAWFTAPALSTVNQNALNGFNGDLQAVTTNPLNPTGLSLNNAADRALLTTPISSALVIQRGLGNPAYVGLPVTSTLIQNLRPYPQWAGGPPQFLGPPLGDTWYDSLQAKVTKRYSHGLDVQGSFTWGKELALGTNSDTSYFTPGSGIFGGFPAEDVFNRQTNKGLSALDVPKLLVISGTYTVPKPRFTDNKIVSNVIKDWQIGAVTRYQSGALIQVPTSLNGLFGQLGRSNGAFFASNGTNWNFTNGEQGLLTVDPNCHCFDPTKQLVLNSGAWVDAAPGQWGTTASYYDNYRWMRKPSENMNFARNFRIGKEGRMNLQIRGEFQNIFNRHFYGSPSAGNPSTTALFTNPFVQGQKVTGALSSGFGYVSTLNGAGAQPRTGLLVARFTF